MEAEQVGQVVDKLAEKIGVAAEAFKPVAEEAMRQATMRAIVWSVFAGIALVALLTAARALGRYAKNHLDSEDNVTHESAEIARVVCIVAYVATILPFAMMGDFIGQAVSPMLALLKM